MGIGAGHLDSQRTAHGIDKNVNLRAQLATIWGIWACFLTAARRLWRCAVNQRAGPGDRVGAVELSQQHLVELLEHPVPVPPLEPTKAGHPGAIPQLGGQLSPRDAGAQHEDDTGENVAVVQGLAARTSCSPTSRLGQQRADSLPEVVGEPF